MLTYPGSGDESKCCGCRACEQACPAGAITMEPNAEGFLYPVLREGACLRCGLCERACPVVNRPAAAPPRKIYAVQHRDGALLAKSSSGGAFRLLADHVIDRGGCVAGCVWNQRFEPVFRLAYTHDGLAPMQGSKYLSSDTGGIYPQIRKELETGRLVLFTGTPCQCAGLLAFLGRPYETLLTADFLCHGVPSQQIFNSRLAAIRQENKIAVSPEAPQGITSYLFRDKEKRGWGLMTSYTWTRNGRTVKRFLNGYFNRYSCYSCPFRGRGRVTDFTFCDFWGVERHHPEIDVHRGVSALALNTPVAEEMFERIKGKALSVETAAEYVAEENPAILHGGREKLPELRKSIYELIGSSSWRSVERTYLSVKHRWLWTAWYALPLPCQEGMSRLLRRRRL